MAGCVQRTTETASMTDGLGKALAWFMVSEKYKENQFFQEMSWYTNAMNMNFQKLYFMQLSL